MLSMEGKRPRSSSRSTRSTSCSPHIGSLCLRWLSCTSPRVVSKPCTLITLDCTTSLHMCRLFIRLSSSCSFWSSCMYKMELEEANASELKQKNVKVVFVLGGPGSGKGTQCAKIVEHFGYTHLSAGDLLRAEMKSGSENGTMIQNMIKEGSIVPSEVTIRLLERAMLENDNDKFLIDGFPRNEENRAGFELLTGIKPEFVLFFDCSEEEMERRLLSRNQGREDDNIDTIRKRFRVFLESSLPVINNYDSQGKVRTIDAGKPMEEVFEAVKSIFAPAVEN